MFDKAIGSIICASPSKLAGVGLLTKGDIWDPEPVINDGALICSCDNPKQLIQGLDDDGKSNCVDECSAGYARRGDDGDENDACDQCRFTEDGANPLALDSKCITCKAGDTIGFPDTCTKCTDNYYLKANQGCVKDCGLDVKGGTHLGYRNVAADKSGRTCEACADTQNCNTCPGDAKVCTECTNNHHLHNGECVKACPSQLKLKDCSDTETLRAASEKDSDYRYRFVPSGGKRDATTNILTGSVCKETVVEDETKPTTSLQLSPSVTHTRDSTLLLSIAFNDTGSTTVTGMGTDFGDISFTPQGQAQPANNVGRVLAKDAYLQVEFQKQGKVTINLPANIAEDESCNKNAAAESVTVVYDIDPPTVAITSFTTDNLVDTVEITISDTLSPIVAVDAAELKAAFTLHPLGRDALTPSLTFSSTPCKAASETTTVCKFQADHSASSSSSSSNTALVPYKFELHPKAAADAAGNPSPRLESPAYHCNGAPIGSNGKCITFVVDVNKDATGGRNRYGADFTDPDTMVGEDFIVGKSYRIAPRKLNEDGTIVSDGTFNNITYTLANALDGWFVGTSTGEITGKFKEPSKSGTPLKMTLFAVDASSQQAAMEEYSFTVVNPPKFELAKGTRRTRSGSAFTDPAEMQDQPYIVNRNYRIAPIELIESKTNVSAGDFDNITYTVEGAPDGWFVGAQNGEISGTFAAKGNPEIRLYAVDAGNAKVLVEIYTFAVEEPKSFEVRVDTDGPRASAGAKYDDPDTPPNREFITGVSYRIAPRTLIADETNVSAGYFENITYALSGAPDGWFVGTDSGEITGVFASVADGGEVITIKLNAVDKGGETALVEEYSFSVVNPPKLELKWSEDRTQAGAEFTNPQEMTDTFYAVDDTYQLPPRTVLTTTQLSAGEGLGSIRYALALGGTVPEGLFLNTITGEILVKFVARDQGKTYNVSLEVVDQGNQRATLETMTMRVKYRDVEDLDNEASFGPTQNACANGVKSDDSNEFDGSYTCDCTGTVFSGDNCETEDKEVLNCEDTESLVDGKCEPFVINVGQNRTKDNRDTEYTDPFNTPYYVANKAGGSASYRIAPFQVLSEGTTPSTGEFQDITYTYDVSTDGGKAVNNFFLSATSGELFFRFEDGDAGNSFNITLLAVDKGGAKQRVGDTMVMNVRYKDEDVFEYGPNGRVCENGGIPLDPVSTFDGAYTCTCLSGWDGENCEKVENNCQDSQIVLSDGNCTDCFRGSLPNENQDECMVPECDDLEEANVCMCEVLQPTNTVGGSVSLVCNGAAFQQTRGNLPGNIAQLAFSGVKPSSLSQVITNAVQQSQIGAIIMNPGAFSGSSSASLASGTFSPPNNETIVSKSSSSPSIAALPECAELVPTSAMDIKVGVGSICLAGAYADISNNGDCTPCDRGGFYSDREGRVGLYSHCACSACQNGTWSSSSGSSTKVCDVCPEGTTRDSQAQYRACPCLDNWSRRDRFGKCESCVDELGIACSGDARVLKPGFYWRFPDDNKTEFDYIQFTENLAKSHDYDTSLSAFNGKYPKAYRCPGGEEVCLGFSVGSNQSSTCRAGSTGAKCAVCADDYFRMNGDCTICPRRQAASVVLMIIIALVVIVVLCWIFKRNADSVPRVDGTELLEGDSGCCSRTFTYLESVKEKCKFHDHDPVDFMTMVKIIVSFTQVKSLLVEVYPGAPWPNSYRSATSALQFMSSNPLSVMMPSCLSSALVISSYSEMVMASLAPLVLAPLIWAYYMIRSRFCKNAIQLQAVCISTASFAFYLLYPTITVSAVRIMVECDIVCTDEDETDNCISYLPSDYSITCGTGEEQFHEYSGTHKIYRALATVSFVFYAIIVPVILVVNLYRMKKRTKSARWDAMYNKHIVEDQESNSGDQPTSSDARTDTNVNAFVAGLSFFGAPYRKGFYLWEFVDLFRKLLLVSIIVFVADGTSLQLAVGAIFAVGGLVLQLMYKPFAHPSENALAAVSQTILAIVLIVGGLLRASEAEVAALMKTGDVDSFVAGAYMITSGIFLYVVAFVIWFGNPLACLCHKKEPDSKATHLPKLGAIESNSHFTAVSETQFDTTVMPKTRRATSLFALIDFNDDGKVSKKELADELNTPGSELVAVLEDAGINSAFYVLEQMDADGDGNVDIKEFKAAIHTSTTENAAPEWNQVIDGVDSDDSMEL